MNDNYYFDYEIEPGKISYTLNSYRQPIDSLIIMIDKDLDTYQLNENNMNILSNYTEIVNSYIQTNNIVITKSVCDLSYQLLLFLLTKNYIRFNWLYSYDELKNKINVYLTIDNFYITDIFTFYKKNEYIENKLPLNCPKYLIYRSLNGFGDRIQCLLYAIKYCLHTGRVLVIDWTDDIWCDNEDYDFDTYFTLKDINAMKIRDFQTLYAEKKDHLTIYPAFYKNKIYATKINNINEITLKNENTILNHIIHDISDDFKEDIVIYSGFGYRYYYFELFNDHFRLNDIVLNNIYQTEFYKNIICKNIEYCVIHLRGGDRMINENSKQYLLWNNNSLNEDDYVDSLIQQLDTSYQTILVVSDTTSLIEKCCIKLKERPYKIYMTNNYKQNTSEGLHKINNISKLQVNLEMLLDFYFMIKATKIINDNKSAFSNISKKITY
jgi:hypothetical protein